MDEVQRAPDLLLSIKNAVDENGAPGRFLLTGSANIMTIPTAADSLAGRMEVICLLPLSQAELFNKNSDFIDNAFAAMKPTTDQLLIGDNLIEAVLSGGYPQALERKKLGTKTRLVPQLSSCDRAM